MPPKVKFTRDEILEKAYEMTRKHGAEFVSARSLAAELGTSTAPIFTAFRSTGELMDEIAKKAYNCYGAYLAEGLKETPAFRGAGIAYVRFAKEEPKLFSLLFMNESEEEPNHYFPTDAYSDGILELVMNRYGMSKEGAMRLYNHLSVYAHGLATLFARGRCVFTMDDVREMLSEVFYALTEAKK